MPSSLDFFDLTELRAGLAGIRNLHVHVAASIAERPRCTIRMNLRDPKDRGTVSSNCPKTIENLYHGVPLHPADPVSKEALSPQGLERKKGARMAHELPWSWVSRPEKRVLIQQVDKTSGY